MTVLVEGKNSFFLTSRAVVVQDDRELAWAEKYVLPNPAHKWVLGKFVEADQANNNRQFWTLDNLRMARPTITHAPMNLLHRSNHIVGAFVATDLIYPTQENSSVYNPYIEALGVAWKYYFPREMELIQEAHDSGQLFYSMECVAESITCAGEFGCGEEFPYVGPVAAAYCDHINQGPGIKQLNKAHFTGGALIVPPTQPGWTNAHITDVADLSRQYAEVAEKAYEGFHEEASDLTPAAWEQLMHIVMGCAYGDHALNLETSSR